MTHAVTLRQTLSTVRVSESLGDRLGTVLALALLPVPLVSGLYAFHSQVTETPSAAYGLPTGYLFYGLVNLLVVCVLYLVLSPKRRTDVFALERPSGREVLAALVAFVGGLGVYQLTAQLNAYLGYQMEGLSYSLTDPIAVLTVLVGAVVLAPLTEEILYRGLVLGALMSRGFGPVSATILMTALFALIHLPNFGVAGTVFISVWGILPAALRLRYDDRSGPVLMHMLNNLFAYVVVVAMGWA